MNLFQKYGIKEVADVVFYSITAVGDEEFYTPVLYLDTLKVSTLEKSAEKVEAKGGKGNKKLITWNFGKEITLNLEDALFSPASMSMIWGGKLDSKLSDYTSAIVKCNLANKYGDLHYSTKAYPSPALTDNEWEIVFQHAHDFGLDSGSNNEHPSIYMKDEITGMDKYIAENRNSLIQKYFKRGWETAPTSWLDVPSIDYPTSNGSIQLNNFQKLFLGEIWGFISKTNPNWTEKYGRNIFFLVRLNSIVPQYNWILDSNDKNYNNEGGTIDLDRLLANTKKEGDYYVFSLGMLVNYKLSYNLTGPFLTRDSMETTEDISDEKTNFTQIVRAKIRYKKINNKIYIDNDTVTPAITLTSLFPDNSLVSGHPSFTYCLSNNRGTTDLSNITIQCRDSVKFLRTLLGVDNVLSEEDFELETIASTSNTGGLAMPNLIVKSIIRDLDSLSKIGHIETDIHDLEVIDRMEKCIVKDRKGLKISSLKQKANLFRYYSNDQSSSYTIYYDAKTMLPLFRMYNENILDQEDEFTIKMGTVYYKWTRTVKRKEYDDDAILGRTLVIDAETFPETYKIVGETYIRNQKTGKDQRYQFIIHRANVSSDTSVTLEAEGDPTTFSMQIDVLTPPNDIMMELKQYDVEDDPIEGGTRIVPQKSKYTYTPTNVEFIQEIAEKNEEIY